MEKSFADMLKSIQNKFTPEYFEELSKKAYADDRAYPEVFSNWYSCIKDFGVFKHANIIANQILTYEELKAFEATDDINNVDWNKLSDILKPTLDKLNNREIYNIKNGAFSNKFDFNTCMTTKEELVRKFWKINYVSAMYDTGGHTELIVREVIPASTGLDNPTIYHGMPLREEIRVFYNMDNKHIEYMEDYWNFEYCEPNIHDISDKIVFNWFHNKIGNREINHIKKLAELEDRIQQNIDGLVFEGLTGIWSIDFLYVKETDDIYLIDMARGPRSAYWDVSRLTSFSNAEISIKE